MRQRPDLRFIDQRTSGRDYSNIEFIVNIIGSTSSAEQNEKYPLTIKNSHPTLQPSKSNALSINSINAQSLLSRNG